MAETNKLDSPVSIVLAICDRFNELSHFIAKYNVLSNLGYNFSGTALGYRLYIRHPKLDDFEFNYILSDIEIMNILEVECRDEIYLMHNGLTYDECVRKLQNKMIAVVVDRILLRLSKELIYK